MSEQNSKFMKKMGICAVILAFLYTFTISHMDCNTITTWAYDLLESIRNGALGDFPVYTYETHNMATNYPLFSNAVNALWLSPVYLIDVIIGAGWSLIVYDVWYKVFILGLSVLSLVLMRKVLRKIGFSEDKTYIGLFLMATSSILLITVLGKGQIDIIDMLFVIVSIYCYLNDKIQISFLVIGIGCLFKPFIILLGVPYLLLLLKRCRGKSVINALLLVAPYLTDALITKLLMPRYAEMKAITSEEFAERFEFTRIEQIFLLRINSVLIFLSVALIICFICLYIGVRGKENNYRLILYPTLLFMSYTLFVESTAVYWYSCVLPFFIIMGLHYERIEDFLFLNLGINSSIIGFIIAAERIYIPGKNFTVLDSLRRAKHPLEVFYDTEGIRTVVRFFATIYMVCMLLIIGIYIYERRHSIHIFNKKEKTGAFEKCDNQESDFNVINDGQNDKNLSMWTKGLMISQIVVQFAYLGFTYIIG